MRLPAELNAKVSERLLAAGTPVFDITVTFNGKDHVYTVAEISNYAAIDILLKAMEDGWGNSWKEVREDTPLSPLPQIPIEDVPTTEVAARVTPSQVKNKN